VRTLVLVDAATAQVALYIDRTPEAKDRVVCDYANSYPNTLDGFPDCQTSPDRGPIARREGGAATGNAQVDAAYEYSGHTYDFYASRFGRDSIDGQGMQIRSSVRVCMLGESCPMDNAFWDGTQLVYGDGYTSADDVVGHELAHGVTEYSSNLYYAYQSGAINESMSDVFGELVDLENGAGTDTAEVRWKVGEDLPGGAIRDMANPNAYVQRCSSSCIFNQQPDKMSSSSYYVGDSDYGGVHHNSGVGNKAASLIVDGGTFNNRTVLGIGVDKAAHVYYRTLLALSSGADYGDLGAQLRASCGQLVGAFLADGSGGTVSLTSVDCAQVDQAVLATEMDLVGRSSAPDARVCDTTETPSTIVADTMEDTASRRWAFVAADDNWGYAYPGNRDASRNFDYAHSGRSVLAGFTAEDSQQPGPRPMTRYATLTAPVHVEAGRKTYVRFAHAYEMEVDPSTGKAYDGGRVEYRVDGGAWTDALTGGGSGTGILSTGGGYGSKTLDPTSDPAGGKAYTGSSRGYLTTRLDLSAFGGSRVEVRLAVVGDDTYGSYWLVDDVTAYSCGSVAVPTAPVGLSATGGDGTAQLAWAQPTAGPAVTSYEVSSATSAPVPGLPTSVPASNPQLTLTGLSTTSTYRVKVVPVSDAGRGAAAEAGVGPAAAVLTLSPPLLDAPGSVTVTARLTRLESTTVPRGGTVTLEQQPSGGSWSEVGTAVLSADDTATFTTTASGNTSYRLVVPGQPGWFPTRSAPVQLSVRPVVQAAWSPSTITFGSTATISGSTSPARSGAKVELTRLSGMTWSVVATGTTRDDGTYAMAYRPPVGGTTRYRVRVYGNAQYVDGYSGDRYLQVLPVAVRVTTAWSPSTVVLGQTSRVYGSTSPGRPYGPIIVQRYTSGAWRTLFVGRTSREGAYVLSYRAPARGAYLTRVVVVGDNVSYATGVSAPRYLSVK